MSGVRPPQQPGNPQAPRSSARNPTQTQPGNAASDPAVTSTTGGQAQRAAVNNRITHESYHPKGYGTSEGLKRARRPYQARNAITGAAILAFAGGVYYYSISKVSRASKSSSGNDVYGR